MVYFVHIMFLLNSFREEWNIHHRVTFKCPTKLQSTKATSEHLLTAEHHQQCDCRNVFLQVTETVVEFMQIHLHSVWFTFRGTTRVHQSHKELSEFECLKTMRWICRGSQVQSSHWGTGEWQYSYSTTVAQRNTSRGKLHNIHFRVCFVFVSFSFFLKKKKQRMSAVEKT